MVSIMDNYLGLLLSFLSGAILASIAWCFAVERRIARLEGKIELLLRVGCGRCNDRNIHGKQ
jgi:hypothetical protein